MSIEIIELETGENIDFTSPKRGDGRIGKIFVTSDITGVIQVCAYVAGPTGPLKNDIGCVWTIPGELLFKIEDLLKKEPIPEAIPEAGFKIEVPVHKPVKTEDLLSMREHYSVEDIIRLRHEGMI